LLWW